MKRGYTLIEILAVLAIMGALVTLMVVSYSKSQSQARDTRREADLATIRVALESYFNDHSQYPLKAGVTFGSKFWDPVTNEVYFKILPNDPLYPNNQYCYEPSLDLLSYTLGADFETKTRECTAAPTPPPTTPAPTSTPSPTPTTTPTPTATPTPPPPTPTPTPSLCLGGRWQQIGGPLSCATGLSSEGQQVGGSCESSSCGTIINYCHYRDDSCPLYTDPNHPYYNQGRRYTTCECRQ